MITLSNQHGDCNNSVNKNCDQCVFGIYYTSDGKANRICAGKNVPDEEAISAIKADGPCDMYDEGHELWLAIRESGKSVSDFTLRVPAHQMYIYDRKNFSEEPVGICSSARGCCDRGSGGYCYCRLGCTSCMDIKNPNRIAGNMRNNFLNAMMAAGIPEEKLDKF